MLKNFQSQSIHDKLTIIQIINYRREGYTEIKVNLKNYQYGQPDVVGGYSPDLSAFLNDEPTICDVATRDNLGDADYLKRWGVFSRSYHKFHIIVPQNCLEELRGNLKNHRITVDKYWYSNN